MKELNRKNDYKDAVDHIENTGDTITNTAKEFGLSRPNLTNFYNGALYGYEKAAATDDKIAKSLGTREANLYKNQYKNNLKAREVNKDLRKDAFYEMFIEEYIKPNIKPINIKKYTPHTPINDDRDLLRVYIGDIHYVDKQRSARDVERISELILQEYNGQPEIEIVLGGDEIENTHHTQQLLTKTTTVMNQIIEVSKLLAEQIAIVKSNLPKVIISIYNLDGNHNEIRQMGVKAREDNETATTLIRELMQSYLTSIDINFIEQKDYQELFLDDTFVLHGDVIRGDHKAYLSTKAQQSPKEFKDIKHFVSFHSHRFIYEIKKGTDLHFIKAPCLKTWVGEWEKDTNNIGTPGILTEYNGSFKFVPVREDK